jgi:hypothetical protein
MQAATITNSSMLSRNSDITLPLVFGRHRYHSSARATIQKANSVEIDTMLISSAKSADSTNGDNKLQNTE